MLDTKEPLQQSARAMGSLAQAPDVVRGRPEMVVVIGLVAVISVAFGFVLGLLF